MNQNRNSSRQALFFFVLTFGLSWIFWVPAALSGQDVMSSLWVIPFLLGGFGPSAAGVIFLYQYRDKNERGEFWKRLVDFKRISPAWYGFILLIFPLLLGLSFLLEYLGSGNLPELAQVKGLMAQPLALVGLILGGLLTGPLSEELGWRGFGLDRLQERWSPLLSSLVIAPLWWAWHLPLFWMSGTSQSEWWVGGVHFWIFLVQIVPLSILLTWAANHNRKSILAPVLLHFTFNTFYSLAHPLSARTAVIMAVLLILTAGGMVLSSREEVGSA